MRFNKFSFLLCILIIFCFNNIKAQPYHKYINPKIGTEGQGNVFIGPSYPFGMVKPGPDCNKHSNSGYDADLNVALYGFSHVHVSGTGGGAKYGNISVLPFSGNFNTIHQKSLRTNENVSLGTYNVNLKEWNIDVGLTASHSVAFHKYHFHSDDIKGIKIDCGLFLGEEDIPNAREAQQFVGSEIEIISDTEVRGYSRIRGGWNNGSAYTVYFYAVTDQPFSICGTWKGNSIDPNLKVQFDSGEKTGAYLIFENTKSETIQMKVGISFISSLKAKHNIDNEIPHWDFNRVVKEAQDKWEALISRIKIDESASIEQKTMFYTALYHTMLMPVDRTDENPKWKSSDPYYDDFYALWDTYRTSLPMITLISPTRQSKIVNSLLNIYQHEGYMPDARSGNCNGRTQGGSNAAVVIADAYSKKIKGINWGTALKAMLKDATIPPGGNEEKEGRGGLSDYNSLGYVSDKYVRAGNRTLEYAFNDYCLAQVAKGIGRMEEYQRFNKQADNWKNLWREETESKGFYGFIMPRNANGAWIDSIRCDMAEGRQDYIKYTPLSQDWPICLCWWCGFFYEGNSWEYSFFVPHDVSALIKKCGGKKTFKARLDTFFENEYYDVSNEPSFLTPCLYHWIGLPELSSKRVHDIINKNYSASSSGIPGNDDSGAMSSWLAFHMLGIYPNAGSSYYLINSPMVKESSFNFENGNNFIIEAKNFSAKNPYIISATLNGKIYNRAWIEHDDIIAGGKLELIMGPKPSTWGQENLPPSKTY